MTPRAPNGANGKELDPHSIPETKDGLYLTAAGASNYTMPQPELHSEFLSNLFAKGWTKVHGFVLIFLRYPL